MRADRLACSLMLGVSGLLMLPVATAADGCHADDRRTSARPTVNLRIEAGPAQQAPLRISGVMSALLFE